MSDSTSASSASSSDYTSLGIIELLPVWILIVPIVIVNLGIAVFAGFRHQRKYSKENWGADKIGQPRNTR
ncbi:membrane-associated protein, putative [Bodo saltans]|uniref:Membrane-associated protein, putative n=1 Tax=Bodo saltans TaxID=75058 RepID=A0A0S4IVX2_BODSA|nr:membrane-associated protein, putative [Bodo saltans]|eukprot:CUG05721.1 membrane-associated protein, putative [Bodo saltans]